VRSTPRSVTFKSNNVLKDIVYESLNLKYESRIILYLYCSLIVFKEIGEFKIKEASLIEEDT